MPFLFSNKRVLWGILGFFAATAVAAPLPDAKRQKITKALKSVSSKTTTSITVIDLDDNATCFEHNADKPLKPASVMKVLTTAAAIEQFGTEHTFDTQVCLQNKDLWIIGSGDPGLGDERIDEKHGHRWLYVLDEWTDKLQAKGVTSIDNLVLDVSAFDAQTRHPDWDRQQFHTWFFAPVGGLNLADNCVEIGVTIADNTPTIKMKPDLPTSFVASTLKIGPKNKPILRRHPARDYFEVSGAVKTSCDIGIASVNRPSQFFAFAIKTHLEKRGIAVTGSILQQPMTPAVRSESELLATHKTSLEDILWRCNTFSQNFFAECLAKSLGRVVDAEGFTQTPGSWEAGMKKLTSTLESLGVDMTGAICRDGSGLSHKNRISTRQIVGVLAAMHRHSAAQRFRESLAQPGKSGTMRRYRNPVLTSRFVGKTGTLRNVRALTGYIKDKDGHEYAFAVIANGPCSSDFTRKIASILAE